MSLPQGAFCFCYYYHFFYSFFGKRKVDALLVFPTGERRRSSVRSACLGVFPCALLRFVWLNVCFANSLLYHGAFSCTFQFATLHRFWAKIRRREKAWKGVPYDVNLKIYWLLLALISAKIWRYGESTWLA